MSYKLLNPHPYVYLQHNTDSYLQLVNLHQGVQQTKPKNPRQGDIIIPHVKKVEIHRFSHRETSAISFDGEQLCFTSSIVLEIKSEFSQTIHEYNFPVSDQKFISSESIQLQNLYIEIPPELCHSSSKENDAEYQEFRGSATITLHTHFGCFRFQDVPVKHKV